ncbi:MAG: cyclodeaminase/cyclohydrolase family protein [Thermoleophilia bacterium]|nr:cyclodeaminase/cyclohydrolase family protein [Thermoleophilia bacterium]
MTQGARPTREPSTTLLQAPVGALIDELAADGRVPGAGSVAAVVAAMAAAVVAMAARAAAGSWSDAKGAVAQAEALRRRALPLADADAHALADALALLALGQGDDAPAAEQRDFALGKALATAAEVPLAIVQVAADVAALAADVAEHGRADLQPDAVGAAVLAAGAARAAAHLVYHNLATTDDDFRVLAARSLAAAAGAWAEQALDRGG